MLSAIGALIGIAHQKQITGSDQKSATPMPSTTYLTTMYVIFFTLTIVLAGLAGMSI